MPESSSSIDLDESRVSVCNDQFLTLRFRGEEIRVSADGSLFFPGREMLVVSDLHLGKSERLARVGRGLLPPYESLDTLARLERAIVGNRASCVVCLGDSFDDEMAAINLQDSDSRSIRALAESRRWIWISGNHDKRVKHDFGEVHDSLNLEHVVFRHVSEPNAAGEMSGHYHPNAAVNLRGRRIRRPCFLIDRNRIILPAFGTYTGGMDCRSPPLCDYFGVDALAVLTGSRPLAIRLPA